MFLQICVTVRYNLTKLFNLLMALEDRRGSSFFFLHKIHCATKAICSNLEILKVILQKKDNTLQNLSLL